VPFYFINLLPTSLLYISILLAIPVGHSHSFLSLLSLSQDWTVPDGVLLCNHTMRISSRTRRLRTISSVGARMCVCVCVDMTYDAKIDTGGERNRV
jgi:hypothetical protein